MISLQKTNSCLLENNTMVLGNDEANVNIQMSRKYKEENIRFYLKGVLMLSLKRTDVRFERKQE